MGSQSSPTQSQNKQKRGRYIMRTRIACCWEESALLPYLEKLYVKIGATFLMAMSASAVRPCGPSAQPSSPPKVTLYGWVVGFARE